MVWQNYLASYTSISQCWSIGKYVMHIHLPDRHNVVNYFCPKPLSQNKVFKVLLCLVFLLLFFVFHEVGSSYKLQTSLWLLLSLRVTLSHVVFGLPAGLVLSVDFVQGFGYFPLQSFNSSTGI